MTVSVFTEPLHPGAFIVSERDGFFSRDAVTVAQSQSFPAGTVLGATLAVAAAVVTVTAAAGNIGDGALTMDGVAPVRGDAVDGIYQVEFISAGATAEFNLLDPIGDLVGTGAVGTPFAGPLKFAVADDAAHHYVVGDRILVQVAVPTGSAQFEALNLAAFDGSNRAVAVAVYGAVTAAGQTARIAAITRDAEVRASDLTWPAGATTAQIAEGTFQLLRRGIVLR